MTFGEALRLTNRLSADPSSHVAASLVGWDYPFSRESMVLADLFDLQHQKAAKRTPRPYPRPSARKRIRDIEQAKAQAEASRAALAAHRAAAATVDGEVGDGG